MAGFFDPEQLRGVLGATFVARPERADPAAVGATLRGVRIDSREVGERDVFVAIRGDRLDGHDYVRDAIRAGSRLVIVEDASCLPTPLPEGLWALRVDSTRRALLRLGAAYRRTLSGVKIIGITGSNGKTTTVRLLDRVLSESLRGSASIKSFNNAIGVPLTVLGAKATDQYLVAEVGTNAPGEISELGAMLEPDIAVIIAVGHAHLEKLGSLEGVAKEKASLANHARSLVIANADAPHLLDALPRSPARLLYGKSDSADLRLTNVAPRSGGHGVWFEINNRARFELSIEGEHNAMNATAAVAVARRLGMHDKAIASALLDAAGPEMRLERTTIAGVDVVNDAYNANPDSVIASLASLGPERDGRRILVLGDMLELGDRSDELHAMVGERIAARARSGGGPELVVLVGESARATARGIGDAVPVEACAPDEAPAVVAGIAAQGDLVLLKGSRRVGLERVLEALQPRGVAGR